MKDKSIRILTLIEGSIEDAIAKWVDADQVKKFKQIDDSYIPESREFRNAWADETNLPKIDIDMAKAKDIILDNMREVRKGKFADVDSQFIKALSENDTVKLEVIKLEQVRLRDITEPVKNLITLALNDDAALAQLKILKDSI